MSFPGIYRGVVVRTDDPKRMHRVRARVPDVMGDELLGWALPCVPPSSPYAVPVEGDAVWVLFEGGDSAHPVWMGTWASPGVDPPKGSADITGLPPITVMGEESLEIGLAAEGVATGLLADLAVTTLKLADGAVATEKLADGAVTPIKTSPGILLTDGSRNPTSRLKYASAPAGTDPLDIIARSEVPAALEGHETLGSNVIPMNGAPSYTRTLTGTSTFSTSGRGAGRSVSVRILPGAANRSVSFPAWKWLNSSIPTVLEAGKTYLLSLRIFSSTAGAGSEADVHAAIQTDAGSWVVPTLLNGWTQWPVGYAQCAWRVEGRVVRLRGLLSPGTYNIGTSGDIFILPSDVSGRIAGRHIYECPTGNGGGNTARLDVLIDGSVRAYSQVGTNTFLSLAGVTIPLD